MRVARSLSMSFGLRYEAQTHTTDYLNFAPRYGATWSPFKSGKTTIRGGVGLFFDWYDSQTYEQTLRVDGTHQTDLVVQNPGFPDPFAGGDVVVLPASRYLQDPNLTLPRTLRTNVGVEQALKVRAVERATASRAVRPFRGRNINRVARRHVLMTPGQRHAYRVHGALAGPVPQHGLNVNLPWHRVFLFANHARQSHERYRRRLQPSVNNLDARAEWDRRRQMCGTGSRECS
jgi:hypothetical protein